MNIKEHIEAGHYPKDEKGRALVPGAIGSCYSGDIFVVCGSDVAGCPYLIGWWRKARMAGAMSVEDGRLLPPPPRKVKVTRWAVFTAARGIHPVSYPSSAEAAREHEYNIGVAGTRIIELTGEYEEPWS